MPGHKKLLILFTNHYPFSPGEEFLENEIEILSKSFEITVVPLSGRGELRQVPSSVKVELSLLTRIEKLSNGRSARLAKGFFNFVSSGEKVHGFFPKSIVEMINYSALGKAIQDWFEEHYSQDRNSLIIYSYWLTMQHLACQCVDQEEISWFNGDFESPCTRFVRECRSKAATIQRIYSKMA